MIRKVRSENAEAGRSALVHNGLGTADLRQQHSHRVLVGAPTLYAEARQQIFEHGNALGAHRLRLGPV